MTVGCQPCSRSWAQAFAGSRLGSYADMQNLVVPDGGPRAWAQALAGSRLGSYADMQNLVVPDGCPRVWAQALAGSRFGRACIWRPLWPLALTLALGVALTLALGAALTLALGVVWGVRPKMATS